MVNGIYTLDDFSVERKVLLARFDMNSPLSVDKKQLMDNTRIKYSIPTLKELSERGAKTVIMTHQGGDPEYHNYGSTRFHADIISELLKREILYVDDVCFEAAQKKIRGLKSGEILMLENVRFLAEELNIFENELKLTPEKQAETVLVRKLAPLADLYITDAFAASHRSQPSLVAFEELLPSAMGRLFEKELSSLNKILVNPKRPCIFILGGAKIEDAFMMMPKVLYEKVADYILTTGLVSNIMMLAKGISLGISSEKVLKEKNLLCFVDTAKNILQIFNDKIIVPDDFAYVFGGMRYEVDIDNLPAEYPLMDIGFKTVKKYDGIIKKAKVIFFNGPAGVFEVPETEYGTKAIMESIAKSNGFSAIGGGESISAINKYNIADKISYISTGGGALIRFISGDDLPVIIALKKSAKKFFK